MTIRLFKVALLVSAISVNAAEDSSNSPNRPQIPITHLLTLAPKEGNPRNSEGDFIQVNGGRWLFIYTHFTSGSGDHARAHLASRESIDGGKTWSEKDEIVVRPEGGFNVMSVSLLRLNTRQIALFYLRKNSLDDCRPIMRISNDEARTWGAPVECITDHVGYYVLNNSRVIQLSSRRLVMPTALHRYENGRLQPGAIVVYLSDDSGGTWRRSSTVLENDAEGSRINYMEPGVVEVSTNRILMLIRTKLGCQYVSESSDRGESWQTPHPSELLSPESPAALARIPSTGDIVVIWNDHAGQLESFRRRQPPVRTPLAAAISRDGGRTWGQSKLIEMEPGHGYCYTALRFSGDGILLGYCAHASSYGLETTLISSIAIADLYR